MNARKFKEATWYDTFSDLTAENRTMALFVLDVLHRQLLRMERARAEAQAPQVNVTSEKAEEIQIESEPPF